MSICSIEDVAAATRQPFWFQLYVMRDRDFVASLIQRAKAARCSALMLTLDLQIQGQRHRDIRNGLTIPLRPTLANALDMMTKPGWALRMLGGRRKTFGNLQGFVKDVDGVSGLGQWTARQFDPTLSWKDVDWIKRQWGGKLILKGILDADDARHAVDAGADAIVVSNHGGRQLDGALSTIAALPAVAQAVGGRAEVLVDGGIRSGQDVLKAMALGARGVLLGRAYIYGLGALGEAGVGRALELIRQELDVSMALTGTRTVQDIGPHVLADPRDCRRSINS
jgi:L-lactate dehydrogenase (cytochrome)